MQIVSCHLQTDSITYFQFGFLSFFIFSLCGQDFQTLLDTNGEGVHLCLTAYLRGLWCVGFSCYGVWVLEIIGLVAQWYVGSQLADQESNPCPLHWEHGFLTNGQPGKSLHAIKKVEQSTAKNAHASPKRELPSHCLEYKSSKVRKKRLHSQKCEIHYNGDQCKGLSPYLIIQQKPINTNLS